MATDKHAQTPRRHDPHTDSGKVTVDPHAPAADYYYHDAGTIHDPHTGLAVPGPNSGPDIVRSRTEPNPIGDLPVSYVYPDGDHTETPITLNERLRNAVDVRIVDSVPKEKTTRFQITNVTVGPGLCTQVLGKDPTRTRAIIYDTVGANKDYLSNVSFSNSLLGFQIPSYNAGGLEILAEDALYILADSTNPSNSVICIYAEYVRSDNTRAETFAP